MGELMPRFKKGDRVRQLDNLNEGDNSMATVISCINGIVRHKHDNAIDNKIWKSGERDFVLVDPIDNITWAYKREKHSA